MISLTSEREDLSLKCQKENLLLQLQERRWLSPELSEDSSWCWSELPSARHGEHPAHPEFGCCEDGS